MWVDHALKCPQQQDWLAVVRVTPQGDTELVAYLEDIPSNAEQEFDAIQQRWTYRATWPEDTEAQEGATIREYVRYPDDD